MELTNNHTQTISRCLYLFSIHEYRMSSQLPWTRCFKAQISTYFMVFDNSSILSDGASLPQSMYPRVQICDKLSCPPTVWCKFSPPAHRCPFPVQFKSTHFKACCVASSTGIEHRSVFQSIVSTIWIYVLYVMSEVRLLSFMLSFYEFIRIPNFFVSCTPMGFTFPSIFIEVII